MERLTEKRQGQWVISLRQDGKHLWSLCSAGMGDASAKYLYGEYADRLAAYEDTGLEPGDVTDLMAAHGTAIGQLTEYRALGTIDHLRELVQADELVGRTIWSSEPFKDGEIKDGSVIGYEVYEDEVNLFVNFDPEPLSASFSMSDLGKSWYLNRKEAEAALAAKGEHDG